MKRAHVFGLATGLFFLAVNGWAFAVDDATVQHIQNDAAAAKSDAAEAKGGSTHNQSRIQSLESALAVETESRISTDAQLQSRIDSEAASRTDVDAGLQNQITEEIASRSAADASLQSKINNLDVVKVTAELCNLYKLTGTPPPTLCFDCGNGYLEPLEECDDGNEESGDGCNSDCRPGGCGDGVLDPGEECDDGNLAEGDSCSSACTTLYKRIFVSNGYWNGDLGGLAGADTLCNGLASGAGLTGNYKAWLSDSVTNAADRLTHFDGRYALVNGRPIADNWNDLTDGVLITPISLDQWGNIRNGHVWTNTNTDGLRTTSYDSYSCHDWTNSGSAAYGYMGLSGSQNSWWSVHSANGIFTYDYCGNPKRLYCFEQ